MEKNTVIVPTQEDLSKELLEEIDDETIEQTRWGALHRTIFYREADDTHWAVSYRIESDGEVHGIRDDDYDIEQVVKTTKTVEVWVKA